MQLIKAQNSFEKESSIEKEREKRSISRSKEDEKSSKTKDEKPPKPKEDKPSRLKEETKSASKDDVNFLIQVTYLRRFQDCIPKSEPANL